MEIQLFNSCESNVSRRVTWQEMYDMVRGGALRDATEEFRRLRSMGDHRAEKKCKASRFPAMLPACYCREGGRKKEDITGYTGCAQADFDRLTEERVAELMVRLRGVPEVLMAFRSMSGCGVHVYYRYEVSGTKIEGIETRGEEVYVQGFRQGNEYLAMVLGADYDVGTEAAVHPSSLCHDEEAYFNAEAVPFVVDMDAPVGRRGVRNRICREVPLSMETGFESEVWTQGEICEYAREWLDRYDSYEKGNRHNYLVRLLFLLSDYGVSEYEAESFVMLRFADYRDERIGTLVASCYRYVKSGFGTRELPKRRRRKYNKNENEDENGNKNEDEDENENKNRREKRVRVKLVEEFLEGKELRFDVLTRKIQRKLTGAWSELTDRDMNTLWRECNEECGENIPYQVFRPVLMSDIIPSVNPLEEYVNSLQEWNEDMPDYIGEVAGMVRVRDPLCPEGHLPLYGESLPDRNAACKSPHRGGDGQSPEGVWTICFRKWFTAMVASWLNPGVANHQVLVLVGDQGIYKTSWLDALMPLELVQYRSKQSGTDRMDKDEQLRSAEFGLINLDEIDKMNERELNSLKSLITTADVNVRAPYGYGKERRVRVASYVASGNKDHFLTDTTGNRRWLPFRVESIVSPYEHPMPYEGMYSQARYYVEHGFEYWFTRDDIQMLEEHVDSFMVETSEEQLIPVYFRPAAAGSTDAVFLTLAEISAKLTMWGNIRKPMDLRQLGAVMRKCGYTPVRRGHVGKRGYIVVERTAEEVNSQRRINAKM